MVYLFMVFNCTVFEDTYRKKENILVSKINIYYSELNNLQISGTIPLLAFFMFLDLDQNY